MRSVAAAGDATGVELGEQGTACLRVIPAASRNCDREAVGCREQPGARSVAVAMRRGGPQPSRSTSSPRRSSRSARSSVGLGGASPPAAERRSRDVGERVDGGGRAMSSSIDVVEVASNAR